MFSTRSTGLKPGVNEKGLLEGWPSRLCQPLNCL